MSIEPHHAGVSRIHHDLVIPILCCLSVGKRFRGLRDVFAGDLREDPVRPVGLVFAKFHDGFCWSKTQYIQASQKQVLRVKRLRAVLALIARVAYLAGHWVPLKGILRPGS